MAARVFQRLNEPTTLLSLAEWETQAAFEAYRASHEFGATFEDIGPSSRLDYLTRLYLFERVNERATVVACATITLDAAHEADIYHLLMGAGQRDMVQRPGLVSREVYRQIGGEPQRVCFLVAHSWRTLADLESFRASDRFQFEAILRQWGATVTRFTGEIAVEFSRSDAFTDV